MGVRNLLPSHSSEAQTHSPKNTFSEVEAEGMHQCVCECVGL